MDKQKYKKHEEELKYLLKELNLLHNKYYGNIVINVQQGNIMGFTKNETIKLT
jgi:hypothetical protein